MPIKSGRNYLCIIDNKTIPRIQILQNIPKMPVLDTPVLQREMHKPRGAPVLQRILGDQFLWEIIIKI